VTKDDRIDSARNETKREQLRRKVAESEAAIARSPNPAHLPERDPPEGYRALAMDYPFALVIGGLALVALAGALLPRSAARKLARGAIAAAGVAGELGLTYGKQALEAAGELSDEGRQKLGALGERLGDLGGSVSDGASEYGRKAADLATSAASGAGKSAGKAAGVVGDAVGDAAESARETGMKIARQVIRLTSQLRH